MPNCFVRSASVGLLLALFAYSASPETFTVLQHFPITTGSFETTLSEVSPGVFVGSFDTTPSEIFGVSSNGSFAVVAALNQTVEGTNPKGPLFPGSDEFIYGSTANYGTNPQNLGVLFRIGAGGSLSVVSNQISLSSPVIEGSDGNLYGTGLNSSSSYGLYKVSRSGQFLDFYVLEASVNPIDLLATGPVTQASDGNFYGEAWYSQSPYIFRVTPTGDFTKIYTGTNFAPIGGLVEGANGLLYGISGGTVFSVTTSGQFRTIYSFGNASALPQAGLTVASDGNLYGTASWIYGGPGNGSPGVFRVALDGSGFTIVRSFGPQYAGIVVPGPALTQGNDGRFFGAVNTGLDAALFSLDLGLPAPPPLPGAFHPMRGEPGTWVRVAGQHLLDVTSVAFNGSPAAIMRREGPNFLEVVVPAGATSGPITVTTPNGSAGTLASFTVE